MDHTMLGKLVALVMTIPQSWGMLIDLCEKLASNGREWGVELGRFLRREPCWFLPRITRTLASGMLPATTGEEVNTAADAVFTGYCDPALTAGGTDEPTAGIVVDVEEMTVDGNFRQIFRSLGRELPELTPSQITVFCRDQREHLQKEGGMFFRLKGGLKGGRVADVFVNGRGRLSVSMHGFGDDYIWDAQFRHRVVVPATVA